MATDYPFTNGVAWAHIQLRGGWKNLLTTAIGYTLLLGTIILFSLRMSPMRSSMILSGWTSGLLAIQAGILLLFGCGTVTTALRTDLASRMIESHRLMPLSPAGAIFGYLIGSTSQVLCLGFCTFLIGLITNLGAGTPSRLWILPNLVLGSFAFFLWTITLFAGFVSKSGPRALLILFVIGLTSRGMVLVLCPALLVLASPLIRQTIFERSNRSSSLDWPYAVAFILQAAIGTILFIGASRKYRRDDAVALPTVLSLLLLAAAVATSAVGIVNWEQLAGNAWRYMGPNTHTQFLSTLAATMFLALLPVTAAARADCEWRHLRALGAPLTTRRPIPPTLAALGAAAIVVALIAVAPDLSPSNSQSVPRAALVIAVFLLAATYVLRIICTFRIKRVLLLLGVWLILTWVGPFIVDLIRYGMSDSANEVFLTLISTASPLGSLIQFWEPRPLDTTPGLIFQSALAVCTAVLCHLAHRRQNVMAAPGFPVVHPPVSKP
ncbi:MAG TPA: hypothetical protein VHP11_02070 [Tepidisphaeraceae bacterium]|nr:hypothetical protein [Tepidisphaeraceae bacterium]